MPELRGEDVVFVGLGKTVPSWYRCALPAYHLGCRWIGYVGEPPRGSVATGNTFAQELNPGDARVWILQQPRGERWRRWIKMAKKTGAKVLYEVDDYLHGVEKFAGSDGSGVKSTPQRLREYEMCMKEADGIIASTEFIAMEYSLYTPRTWICRNGIDTARFSRTKPKRARPNIGWFGGNGHEHAITAWAPTVAKFCNDHDLAFYSIGQQYDAWDEVKRLVRIPFVGLECVPDALANVDIGIAPWYDSLLYKGKSDLRVLEGAAAEIFMVADERGYGHLPPEACMSVTAGSSDSLLRCLSYATEEMNWEVRGTFARNWVEAERDASVTAGDWEVPLTELSKELT
jgi:hypothetical protein